MCVTLVEVRVVWNTLKGISDQRPRKTVCCRKQEKKKSANMEETHKKTGVRFGDPQWPVRYASRSTPTVNSTDVKNTISFYVCPPFDVRSTCWRAKKRVSDLSTRFRPGNRIDCKRTLTTRTFRLYVNHVYHLYHLPIFNLVFERPDDIVNRALKPKCFLRNSNWVSPTTTTQRRRVSLPLNFQFAERTISGSGGQKTPMFLKH